jgi:hypothetical protein
MPLTAFASVSFVFQAAYVTLCLSLFCCLVPGCSGTVLTCPRCVWRVSEEARLRLAVLACVTTLQGRAQFSLGFNYRRA